MVHLVWHQYKLWSSTSLLNSYGLEMSPGQIWVWGRLVWDGLPIWKWAPWSGNNRMVAGEMEHCFVTSLSPLLERYIKFDGQYIKFIVKDEATGSWTCFTLKERFLIDVLFPRNSGAISFSFHQRGGSFLVFSPDLQTVAKLSRYTLNDVHKVQIHILVLFLFGIPVWTPLNVL